MDPVLSAVLGSMHADMARLERVGMNLANVQTPAYKRELVSATPFAARVDAATDALAVHTDQRAGTLKATGQSLDLALTGPGWFEVMTPHGTAYTRQGNFRLDAQGRLVTQDGHPVMGLGGEIVLLQGTPHIDTAGRVFEALAPGVKKDVSPIAQLKLVQFDAAAPLQKLGGGLVGMSGEARPAPEGTQVQQGFLENSNVSHMQEMVRLLETMRHMETLQKVAVGYDEMLGNALRKLGENS
jgi:flagellar basal-body rod protein FlgG